jgi:excisionase family DNA binding protein
MNDITSAHLSRTAYVYVRQSRPEQVIHHPESRRRQYALKERALALGWKSVIVIDDDLGRSGDGTERIGFDRLLAEVCTGKVGAVFAIEDSRLARNGRQWHTLLEFCALVNCLIIDENSVYDPRQANDRLLLGVRGAFSELELSILRQRSQEALRLKAARGELHTRMAVGYVLSEDQRVEMDPDKRVREAIKLIFGKFSEFGSVRQATIWLKEEAIKLPAIIYCAAGRTIEWRLAAYSITYAVLKNPVYAGAYVYGRRTSQVHLQDGRKRITRNMQRLREEWEVLLLNHHEGYISWEQYERNQRIISGNANMKGTMVSGAARNGGGLLAGLLRCGHCGRKLYVLHNGTRNTTRYMCSETGNADTGRRGKCISFGNVRIDAAVSDEVLRVIAPLGLDAALQAIADREGAVTDRLQQIKLALEQAQYEANRAFRQYNAVDPDRRWVADDLERRWNERLAEVTHIEDELSIAQKTQLPALSESERAEILALGTDLPRLWRHPAASIETRKRILRTVLEEIVVTVEPCRLRLKLHWKGGDHTSLEVAKNYVGQTRWKTCPATEQVIRGLARVVPDAILASILNKLKIRTAKDHTWTRQRVTVFRNDNHIAVYRDGELSERGEVVVQEAATRLSVSKMTVIRLIKDGSLPAKQVCFGAPYVIQQTDLDLPAVRRAVKDGRSVSRDPRQGTLEFQ